MGVRKARDAHRQRASVTLISLSARTALKRQHPTVLREAGRAPSRSPQGSIRCSSAAAAAISSTSPPATISVHSISEFPFGNAYESARHPVMSSVFKTANVSRVHPKIGPVHVPVHVVPPLYPRSAACFSGARTARGDLRVRVPGHRVFSCGTVHVGNPAQMPRSRRAVGSSAVAPAMIARFAAMAMTK
jgi:hypothetical protein